MNKNQIIGMALTIMGGTLWGLSGTAVQFLETERHINVEWLISIRLIAAGLFTVIYAFMGEVMGDLNSRRGRVLGMEQSERAGISVVKAQVPLVEIADYVTALRSITQGQGVFNREFSGYEEVPHKEAEEIMAAFKKAQSEA